MRRLSTGTVTAYARISCAHAGYILAINVLANRDGTYAGSGTENDCGYTFSCSMSKTFSDPYGLQKWEFKAFGHKNTDATTWSALKTVYL